VRDQIEIANILAALGQEIMLPQYITPWADRYPNRRIDWIEGLKFFLAATLSSGRVDHRRTLCSRFKRSRR
jgi:hypothetical protein